MESPATVIVLLHTCLPLSVTDDYLSTVARTSAASCPSSVIKLCGLPSNPREYTLHEFPRVQKGRISWLLRRMGKCRPPVVLLLKLSWHAC